MGTTLTGTTPQDTYDSLIKVTDNGPISGTLKALSDGLGNDSTLSLSTAAASIAGTLAVTGNATFDTNTLFVDAANNRVGIGTITPADGSLNLAGATQLATTICHTFLAVGAAATKVTSNGAYAIGVDAADGSTERMRVTAAGNVGIGTSAPAERLQVFGNQRFVGNNISTANTLISEINAFAGTSNQFLSSSIKFLTGAFVDEGRITFNTSISGVAVERARIDSDGLKFNGDTAAANALDDYEEGTWTMGVTFGGASIGVTTLYNTGTYTKIGRQVTVNGLIQLTSKGSSTGAAKITGLPFTIGGATANYSATALRFKNITFTNQFQGISDPTTTTVALEEITILGAVTTISDADFANNSEVIINLTYFV